MLRVKVVERAKVDVQSIYDYIAARSPDGAVSWYAAFELACERGSESPLACGLAPENAAVDDQLRQLLFKTRAGLIYRAVFTVVGDELRILRVRGWGQPPLTADEIREQ